MRDVPPLSQTAYRALRIFFRQPPLVQLHLQQNQMVTLAGTAGSLLAGTSLRELRFRQRFNATVLAAKRTGATLRDRLGRLVLREGDLLLIQAPLDALRGLQQSIDLVVLGQLNADLPTTHSKYLAVAVMATVLLLSGLGVMLLVAAIHAWPAYAALVAVYTLTLVAPSCSAMPPPRPCYCRSPWCSPPARASSPPLATRPT